MLSIDVTQRGHRRDWKYVHNIEVRADYEALLDNLVRVPVTIDPRCQPGKPRVDHNVAVVISHMGSIGIDVFGANIKDGGIIRPPMRLR